MTRRILSALTLLTMAGVVWAQSPAPKYTLKLATLAPEGSTWMQAFDRIQKEVAEATGGQVRLKAYPAGVLGEEKDVLFKIKVGQVDGAGFLGYGIGQICPDANALMVPLLFNTYAEVDSVFAGMRPHLEQECLKNGFVALGWTEIGFNYLYSTVPVRSLEELRRAKPWSLPGDPMLGELFKACGVSAIPVPVGDVLVALQTGLIQTVFAPPLAAVSMQWFSRVKYRNEVQLMYSLGGIFVALRSWEKLPEDLRAKVLEISRRNVDALREQVRKSNAEALQVMAANGVQSVTTSPEQMVEFAKMRDVSTEALKGKTFSAEAYAQVQKLLAETHAKAAAAGPTP